MKAIAASFPVVLGSLRSDDYVDHEGLGGAHFSGTAAQIDDEGVSVLYKQPTRDYRRISRAIADFPMFSDRKE